MRSLILGGGGIATIKVFLSDLKTGCCSSTVQVRLLCYWEARNVQRGEELMGVDMLLLNYQVCSVPPLEFIYIFNVSVVFTPYKRREYTNGVYATALMVAKAGSSDRPAIPGLNSPPFLPVELCREAMVHN
ncbi:hypothetical protein F2Q69_00035214 [Brassica cretica]|uniref:Uncharacterized protein n=1 Tax=Brassica cretica TaxID=69181 RepID=A0A8S9SVE4_BRACR|nr:hypothetical protein F2Q69_00035214 [Brassica cretica]